MFALDDGDEALLNEPPPATFSSSSSATAFAPYQTLLQDGTLRPPTASVAVSADAGVDFQILDVRVENDTDATSFDVADATGTALDARALFNNKAYRAPEPDRAAQKQCLVYLFGVTAAGHSVCAAVRGFRPWLYLELTRSFDRTRVGQLCRELEKSWRFGSVTETFVRRKRVYGWVPASARDPDRVREFDFAHISLQNTWHVRMLAAAIQRHNEKFDGSGGGGGGDGRALACLRDVHEAISVSEAKVQASEKFLASRGLVASGWVAVAATLQRVPLDRRKTVVQLELECCVDDLRPLTIASLAPVLIASVDIEVQSSNYRSFPDAAVAGDKVTFIGTTFWVFGDKQPRCRVMQVLGTCTPVAGMLIESYDSEEQLLLGWRDLIAVRADPDLVVSYNGTGFDFAYLAARHKFCQSSSSSSSYSRFNHLGRFLSQAKPLACHEVSSAGMGQNEIAEFPMPGRLQMDLFQYIKISQKLTSYKLDDVCKLFLKDVASASAATAKVTLDAPGWVAALTRVAVAELDALAADVDVSGEDTATVNALRARTRAALAAALSGGGGVDGVGGVGGGDDDDDDDGGADNRWSDVYASLELAIDLVGKLVAGKEEGVQLDARARVDRAVQPALDASGTDNYRKLFRLYDSPEAAHRGRIAEYCQVDCDLVLQLLDRLNVLPNMTQMSQVTYTLLNDISSRGQQIKTFNLIARHCFTGGYVMNFIDVGWDAAAEYEGATVLPPRIGYYENPVVTLDFASLYPSIMQAYNLCFSSIVLDDAYTHVEGARYGRYDIAGKVWTFQEHHKGLLPQILEFLVAERRRCKKEMKKFEKGSLDYKLADGKQLALKVSCNSVYGFTGAMLHGMFPCMPVAVATTFNGRALILQTKAFMEQKYGAVVIYGDTDSVMVQFPGVTTVAAAFEIAARAARECTDTFRDVLSLEFEKVYCPYLLIRKKHYAGMKYEEDPTHAPTLDAKGLALVRRDNCALVRTTMRQILNSTMRDNNPLAAYEAVRAQVAKLVERQVEMKELEISNVYRKGLQNDHHPQIQVVKNMVARHAFGVPRVGDRVPYVILEGRKNSKVYERAEHPKFVAENELPVDLEYYLTNQLRQRLEHVLSALPVPSVEALFDGASAEIMRRRLGLRRVDTFFLRVPHPTTTTTTTDERKRAMPAAAAAPVKKRATTTNGAGHQKITSFFGKSNKT